MYKMENGSICGSENIACITVINNKEIPTCHNHQFIPYDLKEREKYYNFIFEEKVRKMIQRRKRRERNNSIKLLLYDEKRKLKRIENLEKLLRQEKRILDRIKKHISRLNNLDKSNE